MIELGRHWEYIASGYLSVAVVVALLIAWTALDARRQRARLDALEAETERRRAP